MSWLKYVTCGRTHAIRRPNEANTAKRRLRLAPPLLTRFLSAFFDAAIWTWIWPHLSSDAVASCARILLMYGTAHSVTCRIGNLVGMGAQHTGMRKGDRRTQGRNMSVATIPGCVPISRSFGWRWAACCSIASWLTLMAAITIGTCCMLVRL
eukprot:6338265-Prymnesium_polylepis.1